MLSVSDKDRLTMERYEYEWKRFLSLLRQPFALKNCRELRKDR
jgi:hypothetical protein